MAHETFLARPYKREECVAGGSNEIVLKASTPMRLDSNNGWWLVQRGGVDLFAVALEEGRLAGMRHPLCRVAAGELIPSVPAVDHVIIAVAQFDTAVIALTEDDLAAWSVDQRSARIEEWLVRAASAVFGAAPAWSKRPAVPGATLQIPAGGQIDGSLGTCWIALRSGNLTSCGVHIRNGQMIPIAGGLSLRAETDSEIDVLSTATALVRADAEAGFSRFHLALLAELRHCIAQKEEAARRRINARHRTDRSSVRWALNRLARLDETSSSGTEQAGDLQPGVATLVKLADHLGIALDRTSRTTWGDNSSIGAIARANGIGLREVLLRGPWWRGENGPLIAWFGDPRRPVALIPASGRGYWMWDPRDDRTVAVDKACAAEMAPSALMPYRPLPRRVDGVATLAAFVARGISRDAARIAAVSIIAAASAALLPLAMGFLFESAVPQAETGQVLAVIAGLALAAIGAGAFDLVKAIALLRISGRLETAMQPGLMLRLLGLPAGFFRDFSTGDLTMRILSIQTMRRILAGNTLVSLLGVLFAAMSFVVILIYSPLLALVSVGLVFMAAAFSGGLAIAELRCQRVSTTLHGQESSLVVQIIEGIAKLRVAAGESRVFALWAGLFARQKRYFIAGQRYAGYSEILADVYPIIGLMALFFFASKLIVGSGSATTTIDLGEFLAINAAFGQLLASMTGVTRALTTSFELIPLFERLRPILAAAPESRPDKREAPPLSGQIEVSHVTFRYVPGTRPVLDDVTLSVQPGSFIALVGPSGSGKSTLLRLLLGFETAERGDILYDSQSVRTLDIASLRRQIGVVLQHGRITTSSILENILGGRPYTLDDAWEAARLAGLKADIEAMPMGMHTMLIEGTNILSGGQRQRLMIARALIGRPKFVLFDEATSALDNRTQAVITDSLVRLKTTRIVVAHRLSTVQHADQIFVLEDGRLVQSGTFEELANTDGLFSRLAKRQIM
jgi:NHLM bacteriocin system ABC transporter ATP-binding protein